MSYEEEFDRIMRQKAEGLDYPFDESHWEKASQMIRASRRGKRAWPFKTVIWAGSALTGAALLTVLAIYEGPDAGEKLALKSISTEKSFSLTVEPNSGNKANTPNTVNTRNAESDQEHSEKISEPSENLDSRSRVSKAKGEANHPQETKPVNETTALSAGRVEVSLVSMQNNEEQEPAPGSEPVAGPVEIKEEQDVFLFLPRTKVMLEYLQADPAMRQQPVVNAGSFDEDYYVAGKKPRLFYANVMAGVSFLAGWDLENGHDGRGAAWFAGVNSGIYLNKQLSLGTGVQVFNLSHFDQPFYEVSGKDYDFSSITTRTVITSNELFYAAVPLKLNYHFKGGDQLAIGLLGAQLWRASNSVETEALQDNSVIRQSSAKNNALYEGMNQQLFMVSASYNMKLGKRISAGAEYVYGLNEVFNGATYLKGLQRPSFIRVGITYALLEK